MTTPTPTKNAPAIGETMVAFGGPIKSLGGGRYRGPLVLFSSPEDPDLTGEYFTRATDFGLDGDAGKSFVLYDHDMVRSDAPTALAGNPFKGRTLGKGTLSVDDVAVWLEFTLDLRGHYEEALAKQYTKALDALIAAGKLGLSSGTSSHTVIREEQPNGTFFLKRWFLGHDASLTPTPAEPRTTVVPLKSLMAGAKALDYDDSWRDGMAAQSAVETLSLMLLGCIGNCFSAYPNIGPDGTLAAPPSKADRLARMRAEFEDFADDSLAVIAALMDDDADGVASESLKSLFASAAADPARPFRELPPRVVSAVKGFADLSRAYARHRADEGRSLSAPKRDAIRSVIDGVSPLIDELRSFLAAKGSAAPANDVIQTRLRLLALKHRHRRPAGALGA